MTSTEVWSRSLGEGTIFVQGVEWSPNISSRNTIKSCPSKDLKIARQAQVAGYESGCKVISPELWGSRPGFSLIYFITIEPIIGPECIGCLPSFFVTLACYKCAAVLQHVGVRFVKWIPKSPKSPSDGDVCKCCSRTSVPFFIHKAVAFITRRQPGPKCTARPSSVYHWDGTMKGIDCCPRHAYTYCVHQLGLVHVSRVLSSIGNETWPPMDLRLGSTQLTLRSCKL